MSKQVVKALHTMVNYSILSLNASVLLFIAFFLITLFSGLTLGGFMSDVGLSMSVAFLAFYLAGFFMITLKTYSLFIFFIFSLVGILLIFVQPTSNDIKEYSLIWAPFALVIGLTSYLIVASISNALMHGKQFKFFLNDNFSLFYKLWLVFLSVLSGVVTYRFLDVSQFGREREIIMLLSIAVAICVFINSFFTGFKSSDRD